MSEAIRFPVIEKLLIAALKPDFPGLRFVTEVPSTLPASFVLLKRVGGTRRDRITDQPMVVFEAWAPDIGSAAELGAELQARVYALAQTAHPLGWVRAVREIGGLQSFPDPISKTPRYQFTAMFDTRGVSL
jgi:hypothetical protein